MALVPFGRQDPGKGVSNTHTHHPRVLLVDKKNIGECKCQHRQRLKRTYKSSAIEGLSSEFGFEKILSVSSRHGHALLSPIGLLQNTDARIQRMLEAPEPNKPTMSRHIPQHQPVPGLSRSVRFLSFTRQVLVLSHHDCGLHNILQSRRQCFDHMMEDQSSTSSHTGTAPGSSEKRRRRPPLACIDCRRRKGDFLPLPPPPRIEVWNILLTRKTEKSDVTAKCRAKTASALAGRPAAPMSPTTASSRAKGPKASMMV